MRLQRAFLLGTVATLLLIALLVPVFAQTRAGAVRVRQFTDRDWPRYYGDINALYNFVADAPRVVGFDPFVRLVDFLERERR